MPNLTPHPHPHQNAYRCVFQQPFLLRAFMFALQLSRLVASRRFAPRASFVVMLQAKPRPRQQMSDEQREAMMSELRRLGAELVPHGRARIWKLTDESEMPTSHLARVLAKQKKISEGKFRTKPKIKEEVPPALVDEGWEILRERAFKRPTTNGQLNIPPPHPFKLLCVVVPLYCLLSQYLEVSGECHFGRRAETPAAR